MRRNCSRNKDQLFQTQLFARFAGQDQMRMMNWIECAAKNPDFFARHHSKRREESLKNTLGKIERCLASLNITAALSRSSISVKKKVSSRLAKIRHVLLPSGDDAFGRNAAFDLRSNRRAAINFEEKIELAPAGSSKQSGTGAAI